MLRKSGVLLKKAKIPKKRAPGQIAASPTPRDLKRKLLASSSQQNSSKGITGTSHRILGNRSRLQILATAEDSESEEKNYLPLISTKPAVNRTAKGADAERERQGTSSGGQNQEQSEIITIRPSNYETATEYTMAREKEIEANRRKEDTEGNILQEVEREAEQIPATGGKERGRKQRLVSYSSQDSASSLDETSSRRSGRKRTAVTKMGAIMIDTIQKADKSGAK